jgi:hypothetical protein
VGRFAGDPKVPGSGVTAMAAFSPTFVDSKTLQQSQPGIGIQSTPVIDPLFERMFFSYRTAFRVGKSDSDTFVVEQHVAALDPHDGSIKLDRNISSDLDGDVNGLRQRASLLLSNRIVYVAFAAHVEDGTIFQNAPQFLYRGQILALDANTLKLNTLGLFETVPTSTPFCFVTGGCGKFGGGIWMASTGIAADQDGSLYFTTGNLVESKGTSVLPDDCVPGKQVCTVGDAAVRLKPNIVKDVKGNLQSVSFVTQPVKLPGVFDFFMPYRAVWHNEIDLDLGSSGVLLVPGTRGMMFGGKEGILYVVNRDAMGGYDTNIAWDGKTVSRNAVSPACNGNGGAPVACGLVPTVTGGSKNLFCSRGLSLRTRHNFVIPARDGRDPKDTARQCEQLPSSTYG